MAGRRDPWLLASDVAYSLEVSAVPGAHVMTDLVATGPPALDLRWGQAVEERDDARYERRFFPPTHLQEADGYLHPGAAAAAVISAAESSVDRPDAIGSVAIRFEAPIPLGKDLDAVVGLDEDGSFTVDVQVREDPDLEADPFRIAARGWIDPRPPGTLPDEGRFRALATVAVPEKVEHELYAGCFVCGQANTQGLALQPGWHAPDTVVSAFAPSEDMAVDDTLPTTMVATLLSCPTLWACREQLDAMGAAAALLADYEVRFFAEVPGSVQLRTVGLAGEPTDGMLHGTSALIGEDGRVYAAAWASWQATDEVPAREPGHPDPVHEFSPVKGGRAERHSDPSWGTSLPGRRETAGPRSERPGDHDDRDGMEAPMTPRDPAAARRSLTDRGDGRDERT